MLKHSIPNLLLNFAKSIIISKFAKPQLWYLLKHIPLAVNSLKENKIKVIIHLSAVGECPVVLYIFWLCLRLFKRAVDVWFHRAQIVFWVLFVDLGDLLTPSVTRLSFFHVSAPGDPSHFCLSPCPSHVLNSLPFCLLSLPSPLYIRVHY